MTFTTRVNPGQRDAIQMTEGPLLIIAGPSFGKTFTLVERIVCLITEKGDQAGESAGDHLYQEGGAGVDRLDCQPAQ